MRNSGGPSVAGAEQLKALIDSVTDYAIITLDTKGFVTTWNKGAEKIKGYRAEEIIGQHVSIFYPADKVSSGFVDYELKMAEGKGRFEDEDWRVRKDGSRFWANVIITALQSESGHLIGFGKVTRDLTERKQAEELIKRQAEEILELSTPVIKVYPRILLLPIVGAIDTRRAYQMTEAVLAQVVEQQARVLILDITGVAVVDTRVADHIIKTTQAVQLLGAQAILTGISASVARTIVQLGVEMKHMHTRSKLPEAIELALTIIGKKVMTIEGRE
jgi:PAS domain S-box-containing protein